MSKLPAGVTHIDERGSVVAVFDPRWGWHADPLVYCAAVAALRR